MPRGRADRPGRSAGQPAPDREQQRRSGNRGAPPITPDPAVAEAEAQAAAEAQIDEAGASVTADVTDLGDNVSSLQSDVKAVPTDLKSMAADLATTLTDEQTVLTEAKKGTDSGTICGDSGTVEGDSGTVEADEGTIEGDSGTLGGDDATVRASIQQLQDDANALASARAVLASYSGSGPTASAISAALDGANAAIANGQKAYTTDLAKAKGYVTTADKYAAAASQACSNAP